MSALEDIKRLYYGATRATITRDFDRAIDLLKSMPSEEERERATVERQTAQVRHEIQHVVRDRRDQRLDAPLRQKQSQTAAEQSQQRALDQQLPDQPEASSAQRRADGDLFLPCRSARQQQVRHVRAGDQQHETDRAEQHEQQRFDLPDDLVVQRRDGNVRARVRILVILRDAAGDLRHKKPITIESVGCAMHGRDTIDQYVDFATLDAHDDSARMMWARTDYTPADVGSAQLYDGFSILTMIWLEALGLCPVGQSGAFVEGGARIALDGGLPLNTNGDQLSGGRTHGLGYVHEACLQLWGRAEGRQTAPHSLSVVAAGGGPLGGSLLLACD